MTHTHDSFHSRRRSNFQYLDLQIWRVSRPLFWMTGTPFTAEQICLKFWGLPWKRVWYVWGLLWNLVGNFGSRNYFKSDLLRPWHTWHVMLCVFPRVDSGCTAEKMLLIEVEWGFMSHLTSRTDESCHIWFIGTWHDSYICDIYMSHEKMILWGGYNL